MSLVARIGRLFRAYARRKSEPDDEALVIWFLQEYGPSDTLSMRVKMEALTRGLHNWQSPYKSDTEIHAICRRLENIGSITSEADRIYGRRYRLAVPTNELIQVP